LGEVVGRPWWACGRTSKFFPAVDGESNWSTILNVGSRLQPKTSTDGKAGAPMTSELSEIHEAPDLSIRAPALPSVLVDSSQWRPFAVDFPPEGPTGHIGLQDYGDVW
jgi:hypothetical protein